MIIGNGLLAKNLSEIHHDGLTLFCSGVSDSSEKSDFSFKRERDLLLNQSIEKPIFYFSTVSIFNPTIQESPYVLHKKHMETLLIENFPEYLIIRLPNVVGLGGNKANLFPFFMDSISKGKHIPIHRNAFRYLLAANDIGEITKCLIRRQQRGEINVCYAKPPTALEIYMHLCALQNQKTNFSEGTIEQEYVLNNHLFLQIIDQEKLSVTKDWKMILEKYFILKESTPHSSNLIQGI